MPTVTMQPLNAKDLRNLTPSQLTALEKHTDEYVYIPDHIQPHGILLTLQEPHLQILQSSENVEQFFGIPAEKLLGQSLELLFGREQLNKISDILTKDRPENYNTFELKAKRVSVEKEQGDKSQRFTGVLHRIVDALILEIVPFSAQESSYSTHFSHCLQAAIIDLRNAMNLSDLAQIIARKVKEMTGFNRVMVYRFETDDSGVVIAEAKENIIESYLGFHYPAIDFPKQCRVLFCHNWVLQVPNINYTPVQIVPSKHPLTNQLLDMSACTLRGVSSCHIQYLQNMGVHGSMTISLIDDKRLWGLIACQHYSPKLVDYEIRKACELLGRFASLELLCQQEKELRLYRMQVKGIQEELQRELLREANFIEQVLTKNTVQLLVLVRAYGAAILLDGQLTLIGQTPSETEVQELLTWLVQHNTERVFATNFLSNLYPNGKQFKDKASGILAISISLNQVKQKSYHIIWFRPEQFQTINWAGNPQAAIGIDEVGEIQPCPRNSFQLWKEIVQEKSYPWRVEEFQTAVEMRNTLMLAMLEFSQAALEQAAERAAIANRAKSQFLAKMSHELRTPMNAILGFTQIMSRSQNIPTEFQEHLGIISRSGEHLLTLINDVLEMSKIEAGQLVLTESCFDIVRFIHSIQEMFALKASEKGLMLRIEQEINVPPYVYGDQAKLRQILINLLSNAIKFTINGSITLRIKVIPEIDDASDSSKVEALGAAIALYLEVEDTGCGIALCDLESVFEAFMQTDRGRHAQGTGLGLSISRQFARLMGGDITVQSTLNQGSIFTCKAILHRAESVDLIESKVNQHVISLEPGQPNYRILVAEDVLVNRHLLVTLLESVGFEVCAVTNGIEAIACWQDWHPHLIFMDIEMPEMDGYEATRQIRARGAKDNVAIVALTAYAFEEDRTASIQAGCDDYIAKPFTETILFDKIAHYLGVRYCYAQTSPLRPEFATLEPRTLSPQDLKIMPLEWVTQVNEAALDLNDTILRQLIAQIPSENQFLVESLTNLVDRFQLEAIAILTQA
ncbi:ATP-binding protein [Kamptonema animale CS-326]|jgi:chemotaxis family two-component system sensor kinase Cph1|uniref:response regulator n=1 Tax=Kamptonema animale TaxID=92934 RepID=UPI00232DF5AF|nr:response regulator [Kamptonema animale]MDB9511179.1 ATP-binding protein [Kamptonema animale CS-326]